MTAPRGWLRRRRLPLATRLITFDRARFTITIAGIGCSVTLMLFLLALHEGIRAEANGYVAGRPVHAWVAQDNTTNFIKSSSFVMAAGADALREVPGVAEATPVIRLITTVVRGDDRIAVILLGIDPASAAGRPAREEGSVAPGAGEIVVDRAFARQHGVRIGDTLVIQGGTFRVVGTSRGTNSVLTQLAFVSLDDARTLLGVPQLASFLLVRGAPGIAPESLVARVAGRLPRTNVFTRDAFAANNLRELQDGLLPILATVATLGAVVALVVLTLLLYGAILEQRETWAVLKAVGAGDGVLAQLVLGQSIAAVTGGLVVGVLTYLLLAPLVTRLVPVLALALTPVAAIAVAASTAVLGVAGALLPLRRVARVHPAELFRA